MNTKSLLFITAIIFMLANGSIAWCDDVYSYEDVVKSIKDTMAGSTSDARKESYNYINIDKCSLNYNVLGTYPVGALYDIKFNNIDFSTLNYHASRVGHDYTSFIILNFDKAFQSKGNFIDMMIRTVVINVSDDDAAQTLFKAFSRLGELCGAKKSSPIPTSPRTLEKPAANETK